MNVGVVTSPSEPKESSCKACASNDDLGQTPLWNWDVVVGSKFLLVPWLTRKDECTSKQLSSDHAKERKTSNAKVHTVDTLEHQWISSEEQVKQSVNERHVDT